MNKKHIYILIFAVIFLFVVILIFVNSNNKTQENLSSIGSAASDYINGVDNAQSHLNEFTYDSTLGTVIYTPSNITLEMYNRIYNGMSESKVISILGTGEKMEGENTYLISWGTSNMSKGYWIQIVFDSSTNNVISKSQIGLK